VDALRSASAKSARLTWEFEAAGAGVVAGDCPHPIAVIEIKPSVTQLMVFFIFDTASSSDLETRSPKEPFQVSYKKARIRVPGEPSS